VCYLHMKHTCPENKSGHKGAWKLYAKAETKDNQRRNRNYLCALCVSVARHLHMKAYLNGEFISEDKVFISPFDRGFQFADGAYEVIRLYSGKPSAGSSL